MTSPTVTAVSADEAIRLVDWVRGYIPVRTSGLDDACMKIKEALRARSALSPSPAPTTADELLSLVLAQAGHDGTITPALYERIERHVARSALADVGECETWCKTCGNQKLVTGEDATGWVDCPDCTGKQPRPAAEDVQTVACSRGDLSADDLDRLVDQLCTPRSRFPFPEPIYLSQVALLELAKRLRSPAAHTAQVDRDLLTLVYAQSSHDGTITPALLDAIERRLAEQGSAKP